MKKKVILFLAVLSLLILLVVIKIYGIQHLQIIFGRILHLLGL